MTISDWDETEPAKSLGFLQLSEFQAARDGQTVDREELNELVERLVAYFGSERAALVAVSRAAGVTMVEMAGSQADAVNTHLTMKVFRAIS